MKIALHEFFPSFKDKIYQAFLLYGNKPNLIENVINELQNLDLRFIRTQDAEFWDQHTSLCAPTLFNVGRTVILVQEVPEKKFSSYQSVLNALPENIQLILTSSQFRQHSLWVKNFQQSPVRALVPSYEASLDQSITILKRCLEVCQVPLSGQYLKTVAQWVQEGDWVSTAKTLKLLYQAKNKNAIQQEDLEQLFHHIVMNVEEIFLPLLNKPDITVIEYLRHNDQKLKWVRAWQKLVWQCWQLKVSLEQYKKTHKEAQEKISAQHIAKLATQLDPPIFFKHLPFVQNHISKWSLEFLEKRMDALYDLEVNIKKDLFQENDDISVIQMLCSA
ncbi:MULTISPECIES: hypothetical protein [Holospora]|uniref:DNA polymerase III subunit delta n=2 Tax=Holospora TaxID=44747 RepID=A0A061JI85_9PROT|nr:MULTISPECIES: hypothetical protein [Holospora]ETZ05223.1 DNA polymerase III subunit delta [Holospora undulata HU1]GAJ46127.1 DNA polymerase III subunit delta [Holospora elegans E1]